MGIDGKEITMWQYFWRSKNCGPKEFTDKKQPLLFVNKPNGRIYLPV